MLDKCPGGDYAGFSHTYVIKANKVPIKQSDETVANNTDKSFEEFEADTAGVASLGESTKEANDNQLTIYFDMKDI